MASIKLKGDTSGEVTISAPAVAGNTTIQLTTAGGTILAGGDIGTTIQPYDADTAKYDDVTANFTGTLQNGGSNVVVDTDIGSTVQGYDANTAKYNDATANFTGTLQQGGSNVLTGNQTITLSGDVSGSGTTAINVTVADDSHNHIISNVDGLQTALDAKAPTASPSFTGTATFDTNVLYVDSSGNRVGILNNATDITGTSLDQLIVGSGSGNNGMVLDSAAGGQSRYGFSEAGTIVGGIQYDGTSNQIEFMVEGIATEVASINSAGKLSATSISLNGTDVTATATELNYTDGVTSNIQTQLNSKAPLSNPTFTGNITVNGDILADELRVRTNQDLTITCGESFTAMTDTTYNDEFIRLAGEQGVKVFASSNNLASGLNRETTLIDTSGNMSLAGNLTVSGAGTLKDVTGNYGSIEVDGAGTGGWEGYSIGGRAVFMHNNSTQTGIYNDVDNEWLIRFNHNSYTSFYANGLEKARLETDGDFHADGDVIAYSTTISDNRLKKDVVKIPNALEKVQQINGYTFTRIQNDQKSAGVIAQEIEKVLPEAVKEKQLPLHTDDDNVYKVVEYDAIHGLLIEAIKELKAEIDELKGK